MGAVFSGTAAWIAWNLKGMYSQVKGDGMEMKLAVAELEKKTTLEIDKAEEKLRQAEEKLNDKLAEKYVLKEDFYRETNKLDLKLDAMREDIAELSKNIAAMLGKEG